MDNVTVSVFGVPIETTTKLWEEFNAWQKDIEEKTVGFIPDGRLKVGIIGGNLSLEITPTSLGTIYVVKDSYTKTQFNLTDFSCW